MMRLLLRPECCQAWQDWIKYVGYRLILALGLRKTECGLIRAAHGELGVGFLRLSPHGSR